MKLHGNLSTLSDAVTSNDDSINDSPKHMVRQSMEVKGSKAKVFYSNDEQVNQEKREHSN